MNGKKEELECLEGHIQVNSFGRLHSFERSVKEMFADRQSFYKELTLDLLTEVILYGINY